MNEKHLTVMGIRLWRLYIGWGINEVVGEPHQVKMNVETIWPEWLYLGHWHSHPSNFGHDPSVQDWGAMNGLVNHFGKPLLCFISDNNGGSCNLFYDDGTDGYVALSECKHWIKGRLFLAWKT